MIKCPGCGAMMKFSPALQKLECEHCGRIERVADVSNSRNAQYFDAMCYTCPDCGADILSNDDTAVTFCNYCGNSVALEGRLEQLKKPKRIIPFKKTYDEAVKSYASLVKGALFAPNSLISDSSIDNFRGIYMPYWTYEYRGKGDSKFYAYKTRRSGDYILNDNYEVKASYECEYEGLSFDASAVFFDRFSDAIAPFNIVDARDFDEGYLAGFYADAGDVEAQVYKEKALTMINHDMGSNVTDLKEMKMMTILQNSLKFTPETENSEETLSYFPVWFLANKYGDKVSYAVVNGQTGEAAADIPISYTRFIIGALMLSLPLILLLNTVFTLRAGALLFFTMLFSVVSLYIVNSMADALYTRSNYFDDKGMQLKRFGNIQHVSKINKKTDTKEVVKFINKSLGAIVFVLIVLIDIGLMSLDGQLETGAVFAIFIGFYVVGYIDEKLKKKNRPTVKKRAEKIIIKQPLDGKSKYLVKPMASILISIIILLIDPTMDYWYYGGTIIAMILTLVSFFDLISIHNELTLRTPPQFNRRGGDI